VKPGDVVLGDRLFATCWMIAEVQASWRTGCFACTPTATRGLQGRQRLERRQGLSDNVLVWSKPKTPGMDDTRDLRSMPQELRVRVILASDRKARFACARSRW